MILALRSCKFSRTSGLLNTWLTMTRRPRLISVTVVLVYCSDDAVSSNLREPPGRIVTIVDGDGDALDGFDPLRDSTDSVTRILYIVNALRAERRVLGGELAESTVGPCGRQLRERGAREGTVLRVPPDCHRPGANDEPITIVFEIDERNPVYEL